MADLQQYIDWSGVECLNAKPDHGIGNALKQARGMLPLKLLQFYNNVLMNGGSP
jgi:hypothetical protein